MVFFRDEDENDGEGGSEVEGSTAASNGSIPLLPLRDIVVFPHMVVPLFVGRAKSIQALEDAVEGGRELMLAAQRQAGDEDPTEDEIYDVGTLGKIIQLLRLPDGTVKVLVEGKSRARIDECVSSEPYLRVKITVLEEPSGDLAESEALVRGVHSTFEDYVKLNKKVPRELLSTVAAINAPGKLADTVVAHLNLTLEERQQLLEIVSPSDRLEDVYSRMQAEIEVLEVEKKIRSRVKKQMERSQKEYYLNEQMRAIQNELGDRDEFKERIPGTRRPARGEGHASRRTGTLRQGAEEAQDDAADECRGDRRSQLPPTGCWRCPGTNTKKKPKTSSSLKRS